MYLVTIIQWNIGKLISIAGFVIEIMKVFYFFNNFLNSTRF